MNSVSVTDITANRRPGVRPICHWDSKAAQTRRDAESEDEQEETLVVPEALGTSGSSRFCAPYEEAGGLLQQGHRNSQALLQTGSCHPPVL